MFTNNKFSNVLVSGFLIFLFVLPLLLRADLVPCDGVDVKCDFNAFVDMINGIIVWIISIAGVIFTISFIYGGFLWMTSQGDPGKISEARTVLWNTLKGFVIILVAWLIVYTILVNLVPNNSSIFRFIGN